MTRRLRHHLRFAIVIAAYAAASGCNIGISGADDIANSQSSDNNGTTSSAKFSISGTITGLSQSGLKLMASANNMVTVASGATSFMLPNPIMGGSKYSVTVQSQPAGLTCSIVNGSGTAQANVTNVTVKCAIQTFTIGGLITGLNGAGLVLSNGADTLMVSLGSSAFVFATRLPVGASYAVAVQTQPSGAQCQVANGTGTISTMPITNVVIVCGQWTWMGGSDLSGGAATYGNQGIAAPANIPGARDGSVSWIDSSGKLWLFGGVSGNSYYNDLWSYDPSTNEWTWMSGSAMSNASGVYGMQGVAAAGNAPGARALAASWIDSGGNLWLFGGQGYDSTGASGSLNDLWKFNISQGKWTWVSGANTAWAAGTPPPANAPGARSGASGWIDAAGNLWLFGGNGTQGLTNDLWQFVPGMLQWSLISGTQTPNTNGMYGMQGTAAATNVPGSRSQAAASIDSSGVLWLFGGSGYGAIGSAGLMSDLWKFDPIAGQWTWVGGFNTINAAGNYGTTSTTAIRIPGARSGASAVTDAAGNFWLFGGNGYDSADKRGALNDTWEYQASGNQWIWIGGSQRNGAAGVYGTLGMGALGDTPGSRTTGAAWIDAAGNFWLFSGVGSDSAGVSGPLNDLWEFTP